MNHRDQQTLKQLLADLWDTRNDRTARTDTAGQMTAYQRELLAAAMRIVAGSTNGPNLPPLGEGWDLAADRKALLLEQRIEAENPPTGGIELDDIRAEVWAASEHPQPQYVELPGWRDRILNWLSRK